jgi:hypothetical protein
MFKMLLKLLKNIYVAMLLHVAELQGHLQAIFFKDSTSLHANHTVFLRYAVNVPSYLFNCGCFLHYIIHIINIILIVYNVWL